MKRRAHITAGMVSLGCSLAGVAGVYAQDETPAAPAPPRIACDEQTFDFGRADMGTTVTNTFVIRNEGGQPLVINNVKAGCGCTAAQMSTNQVPAGGQAELTATLSLVNRRGQQKKWVRLDCNDPEQPSYTVWFRGLSFAALEVAPRQLAFARLASQPERSETVSLRGATGEQLHIAGVETGSPHLGSEVVTNKAGEMYDVRIFTIPPPPADDTDVTVLVQTESTSAPVIEIPVKLSPGLGEVIVAPAKIELQGNAGTSVVRQILVGAPGVESFSVKRVIKPDSRMRFMIAKNKPNMYRIQISGIEPAPELNGTSLRILTDLPDHGEILVPFSYHP